MSNIYNDILENCFQVINLLFLCCLFIYLLKYRWVIKGGEVNQKCEILNYKKSLVLSAKGTRIFCTPFINAHKAGNLRFHFMFGM